MRRLLSILVIVGFLFSFASCKAKTHTNGENTDASGDSESMSADESVDSDDSMLGDSSGEDASGGEAAGEGAKGAVGNTSKSSKKSGGGSGGQKTPGVEGDRYATSGEVTVAFNTFRPTDVAPLFDNFNNYYPNIKLNVDYYNSPSDQSQEYVAAKSASGTLPDVMFDDIANLPLYISQGLVYPITNFVKNDKDFNYIPSFLIQDYTYGGELYALPHQAYFTSIIINEDALDALNMDLPALNWTIDDFAAFCKEAVNDKYSAIENLFYLDYYTAGIYSGSNGICGYNEKTRSFEMMNSEAKGLKLLRELRQVPGLEAYTLRGSNSGGISDYEKKFGTKDEYGAAYSGKTVMIDMQKGTYTYTDIKDKLNFKWTFWPYPQNPSYPGRMPAHVDHAFMFSNAKNPQAAFEVLRYLTYSEEGNMARLNAYTNGYSGLKLSYYTPTTYNPNVAAAFKKLMNNDKVALYMYDNLKNCFRGDPDKYIPSFGQNWADVINTPICRVEDGLKDADATCADLEKSATRGQKVYWDDFDSKLATVQKNWNASH